MLFMPMKKIRNSDDDTPHNVDAAVRNVKVLESYIKLKLLN